MLAAVPEKPSSARYQPLLLVAVAVAMGIAIDRYVGSKLGDFGLHFWWALSLAFMAGCSVLIKRRRLQCSSLALLAGFASLSAAWHHQQWNFLEANHLTRFAKLQSQPVCVEAVALGRTQWNPAPPANPLTSVPQSSMSVVDVQLTRLRNGTNWQDVTGQCRLRVAGELSGVERGDRLRTFAQFGKPSPALNPGQFDWAESQRGERRFVELFCRVPQCVAVEEATNPAPAGGLADRVAYWCERQISHYVGQPNQGLALALMLGQRERLLDNEFERFLRTGTVHLLVVSGLHVGFLAMFVWLLVRWGILSQRWAAVVTALVVILYAVVVGARPPVMRATILVLVGLSAIALGRRALRTNLLAAAAMLVLAMNPSELFRGGTQLSFICVAAIAGYTSISRPLWKRDPLQQMIHNFQHPLRKTAEAAKRRLLELVLVSLAIWVVVAPLVAYHFHMASPVSVLLTPVIWVFVAGALLAEFALCAVGWLLPPFGYLLGGIISLSLSVVRTLVDWADSWQFGHFYTAGPQWWWLLGLYTMLAAFALPLRERLHWKWQVAALALWTSVGFSAATLQSNEDELRCTFLAMGHGTCVVLELPGNQTLLYDAGSLGSPERASQTVASYLWSRGISHVDAVVLSHADIDHYNAMPGLLERLSIGNVYVSPLMFDPWATQGRLTAPNFLKETLTAADVPLQEVWLNDRLSVSDSAVEIDFLHPPRTGVPGRDNANSLVLRVQYAGQVILLPGDLESPGIEAVMAEPPLDCDILLAPHHGSVRSDPPGFAAWCTPEWVIVSGRDTTETDDLTAASYQQVGADVLHTSDCGAASFIVSRRSEDPLRVSTFIDP